MSFYYVVDAFITVEQLVQSCWFVQTYQCSGVKCYFIHTAVSPVFTEAIFHFSPFIPLSHYVVLLHRLVII